MPWLVRLSLILAFATCLQAEYLSSDFVNTQIDRHIDLRANTVHQTFDIEARNVAVYPISEYLLRPYPAGRLALSSAYLGPDETTTAAAQARPLVVEYEWDYDTDTAVARVIFEAPIQPNATVRFRFKVAHIRGLKPATVAQQSPNVQWVRYENNVYANSVYFTEKMTTSLQFPTTNVVSDSGRITGEKRIIHDSVGPDMYAPLVVWFEYTKPLVHAHHMTREIKLPSLGKRVKVKECLHFTGQEQDESPAEAETARSHPYYVQQPDTLAFQLPADARNIYCRDMGGKLPAAIATTPNQSSITLHCVPRQPPLGHSYILCHGYHDNVKNYLTLEDGQQSAVQVGFIDSLGDMSVGWVDLRVLLPSGAGYPTVESGSITFGSSEFGTYQSHYAMPGRPFIALSKANVIQAHADAPIQIRFYWPYMARLTAPASVVVTVAGVVGLIVLSYRIHSYSTELPPDPNHLMDAILHLKND